MSGALTRERLAEEAARAGAPLPAADIQDALLRHLELLYAWNRRINLTAIRDPGEGMRRHLVESLCGLPFLPAAPGGGGLLADIGSGNGYPALPLLIARPDLQGVLFDASERKTDFLRAACRAAGCLDRVTVRHERLGAPDELPTETRIVTLRAIPDPARWVAGAAHRPATRVVLAWLSARDANEAARRLRDRDLGVTTETLPTRADAALLVVNRTRAGE